MAHYFAVQVRTARLLHVHKDEHVLVDVEKMLLLLLLRVVNGAHLIFNFEIAIQVAIDHNKQDKCEHVEESLEFAPRHRFT